MKTFLQVILAMLFLSISCASVGRNFKSERVEEVKQGTTTQAQVRELFGEPWKRKVVAGSITWQYQYAKSGCASGQRKELDVTFDENKVVSKVDLQERRI